MTVVAGVDVGITRPGKSTGLCRTRDIRFLVSRVSSDSDVKVRGRRLPRRCDVLAIGGPLVGKGFPVDFGRAVERIFSRGIFQKRCKPPVTEAPGSGRDFRKASGECVAQVLKHVATSRELLRFPHVVADASVVEASPGVFASVMIDDESFRSRPSMSRAAKFGWLLERCSEEGRLTALRERLEWPDDDFWDAFATCSDPEQQAALVCSLTAACVVQKRYVAVGELNGGYFFLPPWDLWADWAKEGIAENGRRAEIGSGLEIWINTHPRDIGAVLPR